MVNRQNLDGLRRLRTVQKTKTVRITIQATQTLRCLGSFVLVCALIIFSSQQIAYSQFNAGDVNQQSPSLPKKQPISSSIQGGETQRINLSLNRGQYAEVVVKWQGMDLDVGILTADSSPVFASTFSVRASGSIPISILAKEAGAYIVEIKSIAPSNVKANLEVVASSPRQPSDQELRRFEAQRLFAEGNQQKDQAAIKKYEEALSLVEGGPEFLCTAYFLQRLAQAYLATKDSVNLAKAQKYYEAVIDIRKRLNDKRALSIYLQRDCV